MAVDNIIPTIFAVTKSNRAGEHIPVSKVNWLGLVLLVLICQGFGLSIVSVSFARKDDKS